jgi:hypothetical protein
MFGFSGYGTIQGITEGSQEQEYKAKKMSLKVKEIGAYRYKDQAKDC